MNYRYKAMDRDGRMHRGVMTALHPEALEAALLERGLDLIHFRPSRSAPLPLRRRIKRRALIQFCFQLEQLLSAGVPILHALRELHECEEDPRLRAALNRAALDIQAGKTLSQALQDQPEVFATIIVRLLNVGEQVGRVPETLQEIGALLKWQDEIAVRATRTLLYPAFLGFFIAGVTLFLFAYLVPRLVSFITTMHGTLPLHTRALLAISDFVAACWPLLVSLPIAVVALAAIFSLQFPGVRRRLQAMLLRSPVVGGILTRLVLARVCRTFAMLYGVGMPVLEILKLTATVPANVHFADALSAAKDDVARGTSVHEAFGAAKVFPALMLRMIAVGESTGDLDRALIKASEIYDGEARERLGRIEVLVEPVMTLILGALLGWIMLSILGPLYDAITQVRL